MSIFTKEQMWQVAKDTIGIEILYPSTPAIVLYDYGDLEQLYIALRAAHEEAVELYEKGIV